MLKDNDKMPFGQYVGEKMINVPAGYLFWLEGKIKLKPGMNHSLNEKHLLKYIEENRNVLKKETGNQ